MSTGGSSVSGRVTIFAALITSVGAVLAAFFGPQVVVNINEQGKATAVAILQPTIESLRDEPTWTPAIVEVTREVEITREVEVTREVVKEVTALVEVTREVEVTPIPTIVPTPSAPVISFEGQTSVQGITFGIDRIEFTPVGKMRLHFWFWNQLDRNCGLYIFQSQAYISIDGKVYEAKDTSITDPRTGVLAQARQEYWYEFERPDPLTGIVVVDLGLDPGSGPAFATCIINTDLIKLSIQ